MGKKCLSFVAVALVLLAAATAVSAQDTGWTVRVRAISINPNDSSGVIDATGSKVAVDSKIVPEVDFTFRFNERFGMELILATARHDLSATGGLVAGFELGSVRLLPPTLTFQYYFPAGRHVMPYVGFGVNYTQFSSYNLSGDLRMIGVKDVDFSNSFDVAGQFGIDVLMDDHWLFNFDVKYIRINTDATIRMVTGAVLDKVSVDIDPWVFGFGVGYRF